MNRQIIDLPALAWYAQVVTSGGFSGAARALGVPRQAVHRRVTTLESELGLRLLERTTRRVRPTSVGQRLYVHAARVLAEARAATEAMRSARDHPSGTLRITAPELFGEEVLSPVVAAFLHRWPETRIITLLSLEHEDLLGRDLDLAIRIGQPPDGSNVTRRLGAATLVCCAAPSLVTSAHPIERPVDLASWPALHYGRDPRGKPIRWRFQKGEQQVELMPNVRLCSTSPRVVRDAAAAGLGVARLPRLACERALSQGTLVELLTAWRGPASPIHAIFSSQARGAPALEAFLHMLTEHMRGNAWLA